MIREAVKHTRLAKWNATFAVKMRGATPRAAMRDLMALRLEIESVRLAELQEVRNVLLAYLATPKLNDAQLAQLHELGGTDPSMWEARDSMELQHPFLHIGGS